MDRKIANRVRRVTLERLMLPTAVALLLLPLLAAPVTAQDRPETGPHVSLDADERTLLVLRAADEDQSARCQDRVAEVRGPRLHVHIRVAACICLLWDFPACSGF